MSDAIIDQVVEIVKKYGKFVRAVPSLFCKKLWYKIFDYDVVIDPCEEKDKIVLVMRDKIIFYASKHFRKGAEIVTGRKVENVEAFDKFLGDFLLYLKSRLDV